MPARAPISLSLASSGREVRGLYLSRLDLGRLNLERFDLERFD